VRFTEEIACLAGSFFQGVLIGARADTRGFEELMQPALLVLGAIQPGLRGAFYRGRFIVATEYMKEQDMTNISDMLNEYFTLQQQIFAAFGYVEDWRSIPLSDDTEYWWHLTGEGSGDQVIFGESDVREAIENGKYYSNEVYTQRFLPKWVYRTETHTMICVDTNTDGNKFLSIFDNAKEVHDPELVELIKENC